MNQTIFLYLLLSAMPACAGVFALSKGKERWAILLLMLSAFLMRFVLVCSDSYLYEWDEKFHALVAKNMMDEPFKPMLKTAAVFQFQLTDWCCNHIWLHKQPLFLWIMALSMKVFGVNVIAMRLPSVLYATINIFLIYEIGKHWIKEKHVAYLAATLLAFSYFNIELTTGRFSVDHNDAAFSFFLTAAIWSLSHFIRSEQKTKWSLLMGLFIGCAVLVKWLTAYIVFGGFCAFGLYAYLKEGKNYFKYLLYTLLVSVVVFVPWQLYIMDAFPAESAVSFAHNRKHISEVVEGHAGDWLFHLDKMKYLYGDVTAIFAPLGMLLLLNYRDRYKRTMPFFAMILVLFIFFSLVVKTKMPAFTYGINSLIWIIAAYGIINTIPLFFSSFSQKVRRNVTVIMVLAAIIVGWNPYGISSFRSDSNEWRNNKISNNQIYQNLPSFDSNELLINCKTFEDIDIMFYNDVLASHWYPPIEELDSLYSEGYTFSAFDDHGQHALPPYIKKDTLIRIIKNDIR